MLLNTKSSAARTARGCGTRHDNFLSNVVTMVLFFNIGLALLSGSNMHMEAFAAVIGVAASMASLTPSACAPARSSSDRGM